MGGVVSSIFGGGDDAGDAARDAADIQAEAQQEALDYLKETERLPEHLRQASMAKLAGIYGLNIDPSMLSYETGEMAPTGEMQKRSFEDRIKGRSAEPGMEPVMAQYETGSQQDFINEVLATPLYGALMGGQQAGEDAILRNAAQTGGLRSGNVQENLYDYNTQLQNQALLQSYNHQLSGLTGLAGMPSKASEISGQIAGIGQTQAQGLTAAAQADQASKQQGWNTLFGLAGAGGSAYNAVMYSDRRLKKNIKLIGNISGYPWYEWDWNVVAEKMGLKGKCQGAMADEVYARKPDAVIVKDLFLMVQYGRLGVF